MEFKSADYQVFYKKLYDTIVQKEYNNIKPKGNIDYPLSLWTKYFRKEKFFEIFGKVTTDYTIFYRKFRESASEDTINMNANVFIEAAKYIGFSIPSEILIEVKLTASQEANILMKQLLEESAIYDQNKSKQNANDNNNEAFNKAVKFIEGINPNELIRDAFLPNSEEEKTSADNDDFKIIIQRHESFWKSDINTIPEKFQDSFWVCHERTDGNSKESDLIEKNKWGIVKCSVEIKTLTEENYTPIIIKSELGATKYAFEGIVTFDSQSKYLIAQLRRNVPESTNRATPTFYIIPVFDEKDQELAIGYTLYFSIISRRFITKTVVWQHSNVRVPVENLDSKDKKFSKIDLKIRRYLNSRVLNRLTLPSLPITNLDVQNRNRFDSLQNWLMKRTDSVESDSDLMACVDTYYICYFAGDIKKAKYPSNIESESVFSEEQINECNDYLLKSIQVDKLEISFDENQVEFIAKYIHTNRKGVESSSKKVKDTNFNGYVRIKKATVEVILEQEKRELYSHLTNPFGYKNTSASYILLNFCIPIVHENSAKETLNDRDFFPGLLSGLNDKNNNPISFKALVIKRKTDTKGTKKINYDLYSNLLASEGKNELSKLIIQYFRDNLDQSQISVSPL